MTERLALWAALWAAFAATAPVHADDRTTEYDFTVTTSHPLDAEGHWIGGMNVGYYRNFDADYYTNHLEFNLLRKVSARNSLALNVIGEWKHEGDGTTQQTDYFQAGINTRLGSLGDARFANFARVEYVDQFSPDSSYTRLRERLAVQWPFGRNHYASRSAYGFANSEIYYQLDPSFFSRVDARVGIGYVINDFVRVEAGYDARWTRDAPGDSLAWTLNTWSLTFSAVRNRGLLRQVDDIVGGRAD